MSVRGLQEVDVDMALVKLATMPQHSGCALGVGQLDHPILRTSASMHSLKAIVLFFPSSG